MRNQVWTISTLAALVMLFSYGEVRADYLVVTVKGTVLPDDDSDSSGILGFGVSPTASDPAGTAAGQPVMMTFVLDLSRTPPNVCLPPGSCNPYPGRAYYFTNTAPASSWISATDSIGGKVVPEFAPHGGNFSSPAFAQLWTTNGSNAVYNELDVSSDQTVRTIIPMSGGAHEEILATDDSDLRIDSITKPFLTGLSLDQSFSWNPSMNDGLSIGDIERQVMTATCSDSLCTSGETLLSAFVDIQLDSVTGEVVQSAPVEPAPVAPIPSAPEPGTLVLMVLGLAGIGFARRKHRV